MIAPIAPTVRATKYVTRPTHHPIYDTHWFDTPYTHESLFMNTKAFRNAFPKTERDTNLMIDGMLGVPLEADWSYMRLYYESTDVQKIREFNERVVIRFVIGMSYVFSGPLTPASFTPILPALADQDDSALMVTQQYIKTKYAKGELVVPWPWLEFSLTTGGKPLRITSNEAFRVDLDFPTLPGPADLRVKVILGPTLYRPI